MNTKKFRSTRAPALLVVLGLFVIAMWACDKGKSGDTGGGSNKVLKLAS